MFEKLVSYHPNSEMAQDAIKMLEKLDKVQKHYDRY